MSAETLARSGAGGSEPPIARALATERYDVAAMRLLYGLLVTLESQAPAAREALLDALATDPGDAGETGGAR